jgi:hypothetical protein
VAADYQDWWWKERLGKGYYMLGLFRDAEKQFKSSQKSQNMITTVWRCRLTRSQTVLKAFMVSALDTMI